MSACHILLHSFVFEVAQEREGGREGRLIF